MINSDNWFASWFDSPYYHTLYKNRDFKEAEFFIKNLALYLAPKKGDHLLDLACGAGRHSIYLNNLGYNVTGVDLSPNSIKTASKFQSETLAFDVHDMREVYQANEFNFIFNLFTSFGYFDSDQDNIKMLQSVEKSLKKDGIFVLDFFNATQVISQMKKQESKVVDNITFNIRKELKDGHILKHIDFNDDKAYSFTEKVQAIHFSDFEKLFSYTNMKIITTFGNYSLEEFDPQHSDRLIIVAKK